MVLLARDMRRAPNGKPREARARFVTERRKLRIAHTPPAVELLDNELAVKEKVDL
jgi:hypothetical protein